MKKLILIAMVAGLLSGCAADTAIQAGPIAAETHAATPTYEAQASKPDVDPVIVALGLFLLAGVITANTVAHNIGGALIP